MANAKYLITLKLRGIHLKMKSWKYLSNGLSLNKSLKVFEITHTFIPIESFARIVKPLYRSKSIEVINLSNNKLKDDYGFFIKKIISYQSEKRDEIVWLNGLRGEIPKGISYRSGLHTIILSNNSLTDKFLFQLCEILNHDLYMLSIDLSENNIGYFGMVNLLNALKTALRVVLKLRLSL